MSEFKKLHKDAIPAALEKAERYRLLNEPGEAESICLDILAVDPENQQAVITLLLALTDRFEKGYAVSDTQTITIEIAGPRTYPDDRDSAAQPAPRGPAPSGGSGPRPSSSATPRGRTPSPSP